MQRIVVDEVMFNTLVQGKEVSCIGADGTEVKILLSDMGHAHMEDLIERSRGLAAMTARCTHCTHMRKWHSRDGKTCLHTDCSHKIVSKRCPGFEVQQ